MRARPANAERQASALEETAAAMEQFSTSVNHNAENCALASEKARDADAKARHGARIVHGVVEAMGGIIASTDTPGGGLTIEIDLAATPEGGAP